MIMIDKKNIAIILIVIALLLTIVEKKNVEKEADINPPNQMIDHNDDNITKLAAELRKETTIDTIWAVSEWVYTNIEYGQEGLEICRQRSASDVLEDAWGDCTGMSKLTTALLQANNIPSCIMGGCISNNKEKWGECTYEVYAIVPRRGVPPEKMRIPDLAPQRFEEGYPLKSGLSHSWVKAWANGRIVLVEPSSGIVLEADCNAYSLAGPQCIVGSGLNDQLYACVIYLGNPVSEKEVYDEYVQFCNEY